MAFYVTKEMGYVVQMIVLYVIHSFTVIELYLYNDLIEQLGEYEIEFQYITGWPLYGIVFGSYILACWVPAGTPPKYLNIYEKEYRDWSICELKKPPRSSHCSRCRICVLYRDHHWDYTNQCVGANNYKYFAMFVFFTPVGILHFMARSAQFVYHWCYQKHDAVKSTPWTMIAVIVLHMYIGFGFLGFLTKLQQETIRNLSQGLCRINLDPDGYRHPNVCERIPTEPVNAFDRGLIANIWQYMGRNPFYWATPLNNYDVISFTNPIQMPELTATETAALNSTGEELENIAAIDELKMSEIKSIAMDFGVSSVLNFKSSGKKK